MLAELGGGCQVPIGAFGTLDNTELFLTGAVFAPDGSTMIRYTATGECTRPAELGRNVAQVLLKRGAQAILDIVYEAEPAPDGPCDCGLRSIWSAPGPGDPELITVKAKRLLEQADCILYDHLASADLLDLAPASAERIYVGKKKSEHALSQEEICALLVERGKRGLNVVRLKGGDPFIFGRGGEEAEALADAGIPFEVVPGVTSPLGIAAYTGVPLTHRDHTSVVTFITGHDVLKIDWTKVGTSETLVIFMGLSQFDEIARADHRRRARAAYTRDGRALGHAARSGGDHRHARSSAGPDPRARAQAARDDR